jgi:Predicted transcriptional regulators
VSKAAELLGERWTFLIIRELVPGATRFNDFQRALSQISPTLLMKRLNSLKRPASSSERRCPVNGESNIIPRLSRGFTGVSGFASR